MYLAFFDGVEGLRDADEQLRTLIREAEALGYQIDTLEGRTLLAALLKHRGDHVGAKREYEQVLALAEGLGIQLNADDAREALRELS
jgi:hypothetical protein